MNPKIKMWLARWLSQNAAVVCSSERLYDFSEVEKSVLVIAAINLDHLTYDLGMAIHDGEFEEGDAAESSS